MLPFFDSPEELLLSAGRGVFEGIVTAAVLAGLAMAWNWRARRDARAQIRDQILRVLGLRLNVTRGWIGASIAELVELPPTSIRGREALGRLQWQIDLYRNYISSSEMNVLQGAVESLDRLSVNPGSASTYYARDALPRLVIRLLPRQVREQFKSLVERKHWSELLATRDDLERRAQGH